MENQKYNRREIAQATAGYKITLRKANPDRETARQLYLRIRELETRIS